MSVELWSTTNIGNMFGAPDGVGATTVAALGSNDESPSTFMVNHFGFDLSGSGLGMSDLIQGVIVEIVSKGSSSGKLSTSMLRLAKDSQSTPFSEGRHDIFTENYWGTTYQVWHQGGSGPTDTWGFGLTRSDVEQPTFGVNFQVENARNGSSIPYVDCVRVTVYYGTGPGDNQTRYAAQCIPS